MIKIAIQEIEKSLAPIHRQFSAEFRFHKPNSFGQYCHWFVNRSTFLWQFITGEIQRDKYCSLVAGKTICGYLYSSPLTNNFSVKQINPTHITNVCNQDVFLLNWKADRFGDVGIKEKETSVYRKFISNTKSKKNHYSVYLLFKENRPMLPDNYKLNLNHLKKLQEQLDKMPHLLKKCR